MAVKLSILIPSLVGRAEQRQELLNSLNKQIDALNLQGRVQIVLEVDYGEMTIGEKRNKLMSQAKGEYIAFIDDDDMVSDNYIKLIFEKIMPDCCSMTGVITWDGENPEIFEHSIKYKEWKTNEQGDPKYERYPNHLNVIRKDIAIKYDFIPVNEGEDHDWSMKINSAGELKNEAQIGEVLYHYKFKRVK